MQNNDKLLEELAKLHHERFVLWSQGTKREIRDDLFLDKTPETILRMLEAKWDSVDKPYSELTEDAKEYNREWARKVIDVVKKYSNK